MAEPSKREAATAIGTATGTFSKDSADPVTAILAKYDKNGDGVFQIEEVRGIVHDVMKTKESNKMLKKFVGLLIFVVISTLVAMFGVSFAAGFALKDSHVSSTDQVVDTMPMVANDGAAVSIEVTSSDLAFFALPTLSAAELASIATFDAYVDMTTGPVGAWAELSGKIATVYKADNTKAFLETVTGHLLEVDAGSKTAFITMNGNKYPVVIEKPAAMRRLNAETATEDFHPRRRARRGAFLSTSGSFKMAKTSNRGGNT